jgi:hypothetical protein
VGSRRATIVVLFGLLVLLAGCQGFLGGSGEPTPTVTPAPLPSTGTATAVPSPSPAATDVGRVRPRAGDRTPSDPAEDRIGWEGGYWHNETIDLNPTGISRSELGALTNRSMARVEFIRREEFDPVPVETVPTGREPSRQLRAFNRSRTLSETAKLEPLFLLEETGSVRETWRAFYEFEPVHYDAREGVLVVGTDDGRSVLPEDLLATKLSLALQDQQYGDPPSDAFGWDRYHGSRAVVQGEVWLVGSAYTDRCARDWQCFSPTSRSGVGNLSRLHRGHRLLLAYPFADGESFVREVHETGGWDAVTALQRERPRSSLPVSLPDRRGDFEPRSVSLSVEPDRGWNRVRFDWRPDHFRFGPASLAVMRAYTAFDDYNDTASVGEGSVFAGGRGRDAGPGGPIDYAASPGENWTGDRLHYYRKGVETGYVWRLTWRSPADARQFADQYRAVLGHWDAERRDDGRWAFASRSPFDGSVDVRVAGDAVTIVHGPDPAAVDALMPDDDGGG